jgi:hypothetical protein
LLIPALLALLLETLITTARHWLLPLKKLIDGIIVLLFLRCILIEKLFKLRVSGLPGVIGILLNTDLFVLLLILKECSFLLG